MNFSVYDIAELISARLIGEPDVEINSLTSIDEAVTGALVFADSEANFKKALESQASAILTNIELASDKPLLIVERPMHVFIKMLAHLYPEKRMAEGIHPTAVIADDAIIGRGVAIGPHVVVERGAVIEDNCQLKAQVYIGEKARIGADSVLHPQVCIYHHCEIGARVLLHAGVVVGSDGFGYVWTDDHHMKMPHVGKVVIGDDVEIGANTVVDRASLGKTTIGKGTKIDNLVQIAHSVSLGAHNIVCAFTGIAGSTRSGDRVVFAANVGVADHVTIDDDVVMGARTGVPPKKHLLKGQVYLGAPARPKDKAIELELSANRIPGMRKNLRALSERVDTLEKSRKATEEV